MTTEIKSPTYPESVSDGTIANWVKKEGQVVKQDELIAEIETDKIVLEVLSPIDGKLSKIIKDEGEIVLSGELIAQIELESGPLDISLEDQETKKVILENTKTDEAIEEIKSIGHGPAIRRLLEEHNIDSVSYTHLTLPTIYSV